MPTRLYRRVTARGFTPRHVAEVGVSLPATSNIRDWIVSGVRATLVEADPLMVERIRTHFSGCANLTVHAVAACDFEGTVELCRVGPSTFVRGQSSPAAVNDGYRECEADTFTAPARLFSRLDDGSVELLSVDVEGVEWWVIRHLVSRPAVISVETHGAAYVNPHLRQIQEWMASNAYTRWYMDGADTVYVVRGGPIRVTPIDRVCLALRATAVVLRRWRKRLPARRAGRRAGVAVGDR
jgi:hypothetical protein